MSHRPVPTAIVLAFLLALPSCATFQSFLALSQVDFSLDRVSETTLAGVQLDRMRSYRDITGTDVFMLGRALADGRLPLELTVEIGADNPDDNPEARLVGMDWTLFLDGRETITGVLAEAVRMPPGAITPVPVTARLDLLEFFDGGLEDLVNLAISLAGADGEPANVRMEILPTVDTPLGPIRYPRPLVIGRD